MWITNIIAAIGIENSKKKAHLTINPTAFPSNEVPLSASLAPSKIVFNGVAANPNVLTTITAALRLYFSSSNDAVIVF